MLWPFGHPGISTPESLRGSNLRSTLPSVLPVAHLHVAPCGFHRFEPVKWNGVATALGNVTYPTRNFARLVQAVSSLVGLYLESLAIHLFGYCADTIHAVACQMVALTHQIHDLSELDEVDSLA